VIPINPLRSLLAIGPRGSWIKNELNERIPMSDTVAKNKEKQVAVRAKREQELHALWKTYVGQRQVLNLFWTNRDSRTALQVGDSVIQSILEHEFGPSGI